MMHDYDDEQSEAESLKKSTSDKIHAATHHWHWVDTIVHVLHVLIIIVASRMKLMDVANLREREGWEFQFIAKNYLEIASRRN